MAHRLLPFRQYDENDVVNLFSVDVSTISNFISQVPATDGINADGVLVKVKAGDHNALAAELLSVSNKPMSFLDKASIKGFNYYQKNFKKDTIIDFFLNSIKS